MITEGAASTSDKMLACWAGGQKKRKIKGPIMKFSNGCNNSLAIVTSAAVFLASIITGCKRPSPPIDTTQQAYADLQEQLKQLSKDKDWGADHQEIDLTVATCEDIRKAINAEVFTDDLAQLERFQEEGRARLSAIQDRIEPVEAIQKQVDAAISNGRLPNPMTDTDQKNVERVQSSIKSIVEEAKELKSSIESTLTALTPPISQASQLAKALQEYCPNDGSALSGEQREELEVLRASAEAAISAMDDAGTAESMKQIESSYAKLNEAVSEFRAAWEEARHLFPQDVRDSVENGDDKDSIELLVEAFDTALEFVSDVITAWGLLALIFPVQVALVLAFLYVAFSWFSNSPGFQAKKPNPEQGVEGDEGEGELPGDQSTLEKKQVPDDRSAKQDGDIQAMLGGTVEGDILFEDFFREGVFYLNVIFPNNETRVLRIDASAYEDEKAAEDVEPLVSALRQISEGKRRGNVRSISGQGQYPIIVVISGLTDDAQHVGFEWINDSDTSPVVTGL